MKKTLIFGLIAVLVGFISIQTVSAARGYGGSTVIGNIGRPSQASNGQVLGASTFKFTPWLVETMNSQAVKELQNRLRSEGFFTFPTSTGYFGPITLVAVKAYQTAHGIISTGLVGPLTVAELNK